MDLHCVLPMMVVTVLMLGKASDGARILIIGVPAGSHYMSIEQIAVGLLANGHDVHSYMNGDCKDTKKMANLGVKVHGFFNQQYPCQHDNKTWVAMHMQTLMSEFSVSKFIEMSKAGNAFYKTEIEAFLGNNKVLSDLHDLKFDLCIVDAIFNAAVFRIVPYKLGIPVVSVLAVFDPKVAGLPALPSVTPYINFGTFTNEMNFMQRISNFLNNYAMDFVLSQTNPGSDSGLVSRFAPEKPYRSLRELETDSVLWLVMNDPIIDYPQIRMPHVIDIGGINTRPPKPLPEEFQKLADEARHGLIVVSFGSYVSSFPPHIKLKLVAAFKQLKETVVWRLPDTKPGELGSNIYTANWIPQNDLLAHPNTKLFITHCGANSQFEALFNAVPMLGLPIFGDQGYNSVRMEHKGLGIHLDFFNAKSEDILSSARDIIDNSSYTDNIKLHSKMFKDRPMTPIQTSVYWIEHVLKYGSQHLLSPALHYPWYKYYSIDVICFIAFVASVALLVCCTICRCLCNRCKRKEKQQ